MTGLTLYELLYASLDLPDHIKTEQLQKLLSQHNIESNQLTMENLREIVADLLHSMILESESECQSPQQ